MDYPVKTAQQLGQVLQGCRKHRGLTQADAGAKVGFKQNAVSNIEADPSKTSVERLLLLLSALGVELVVRDSNGDGDKSAAPASVDRW